MDPVEIYKLLGATLGFVSAGFAVWDRFMRFRPSVSITVDGLPSLPQLRLKNQAPFDIVIEAIEFSAPGYRVLAANTVRGAVFSTAGKIPSVLLAPAQERLLALIEPPIEPEAAVFDDRPVSILVRWTRGDHPLLRPFPVKLWTSARDIHARQTAADLWAQEQRYKGVKST